MTRAHRSGRTRSVRRTNVTATLWIVVLIATLASTAGATPERYRGRSLGDVLSELRARGLTLMYSSAVVDTTLEIPVEPVGDDPVAILEQVLASLGLRADPGPGRVLLVVPDGDAGAGARGGREARSRLPAALGYRAEIRVVPGERGVDDGDAAPVRSLQRADVLLVPAIGGDLGRAIDKLPGVVNSDNSSAWSVRGSLPGDTSLVVDGLELYDPYHLREFQSPFTLIDPGVVDRVDVLPGGFTVEYGDRHGAFVEIETDNRVARPGGELEVGTLNSRVAIRAPLSDGTGAWLVSGRGWYPEAVVDSLGLGGGERLRPRMGDLFAKWIRAGPGGTVWSVHGLLSHDRIGFEESGEDDDERVDAVSRLGNVWARAVRLWSARLRGETVVSAGEIRRSRDGLASPEEDEFTVRDRRELSYLGASQELVWAPREGRRFKIGASARRLDARYRYELRPAGGVEPDRAVRLDPGGWQFGLYAAHRRRLAPGLAVEVGARWDRQEVGDDDGVSPRAHLVWSPSARTETRLAVGRFRQSQRVHELAVADGETTFSPAEVSEQVEWMLRHTLASGVAVRVDLYHRRLDRLRPRYENLFSLVELFPEAADDRVRIAPERATLRGMEWTVEGPDRGSWRWWAAYALASAEDRVDGRDVPRALDQRHTASFLVAWRGRPRWTLALSGTAHTGRPYTTVTAEEVVDPDGASGIVATPGPRNARRLPDYVRFDLKVARRTALRRGTLTWTVDVLNLLDRDNACCIADFLFRPGGDGTVDVGTEFETWLGIVPTLSVRWEY